MRPDITGTLREVNVGMSEDVGRHVEAVRDAAHAIRILVVDDELLIRWALGQTLRAHGCLVTEAATGREALSALRSGTFDVVVLDYRLPDTLHLNLLREIRNVSPASHVVMMTALGTAEMVDEAMELGVSRVLEKPIDLNVATKAILNL